MDAVVIASIHIDLSLLLLACRIIAEYQDTSAHQAN